MSYDAEGAINVMLNGLNMDRPKSFQQADGLVSRNINRVPATLANIIGAKIIFELAWTLLSQRRYKESAEWFLKVTELNSWSVISSCRRHEPYSLTSAILSGVTERIITLQLVAISQLVILRRHRNCSTRYQSSSRVRRLLVKIFRLRS